MPSVACVVNVGPDAQYARAMFAWVGRPVAVARVVVLSLVTSTMVVGFSTAPAHATQVTLLDTMSNAGVSGWGIDQCASWTGFGVNVPSATTVTRLRIMLTAPAGETIQAAFFEYNAASTSSNQDPFAGLAPVASLGTPAVAYINGYPYATYTGNASLPAGKYFLAFKGVSPSAGIYMAAPPGTATSTGPWSFYGETSGTIRANYCQMFNMSNYTPKVLIETTLSAPVNTSAPVISGQPLVGETLTASTGSWTNSPANFGYQWSRCDAAAANCSGISNAVANEYLLATGDIGSRLSVTVTATNAAGSDSATATATALVTAPVPPAPPAPVWVDPVLPAAPPQVRVSESANEVKLTCSAPTFDPVAQTIAYEWRENGNIVGTTA